MANPEFNAHGIEEESYFVSMTDLMVGMLFVFIVMLMAFALNLRDQEEKFTQTTSALTQANETRKEMLEDIKKSLEQRGVKVIVDPENGVLRLPEELLFPRGQFQLTARGHEALIQLANVLNIILPCYANSQIIPNSCPNTHKGRLEALFIEGHTDDRAIAGRMANGITNNWELSTERAIATFNALIQQVPALEALANDSRQKLLGVSGYAQYRPVRNEDSEEARAANRRIDLRFLMETPTTLELTKLKSEVERGRPTP
jgi:flagellar motor protein MotB